MISESEALPLPTVDQWTASHPDSTRWAIQRGERFMSTSNFMSREARLRGLLRAMQHSGALVERLLVLSRDSQRGFPRWNGRRQFGPQSCRPLLACPEYR